MLFLGIDLGSSGVRGVLYDSVSGSVVEEQSVLFDKDLPSYGTVNGVVDKAGDPAVATDKNVPVLMLVEALDVVLAKFSRLSECTAVSCSGQQHGVVFLTKSQGPFDQHQLARPWATSWQDSSTTDQCRQFEALLGGPTLVASRSGSRAYERFSAHQIGRVAHLEAGSFDRTQRIHLISSFATALCCDDLAVPMDQADASGTNLFDVFDRHWWPEALAAAVPSGRLTVQQLGGPPVPSWTQVGTVCTRWQRQFQFPANCPVVAGSGDNPCALASMAEMRAGDLCVSLGTSHTLLAPLPVDQARQGRATATGGHLLVHPLDPASLMAMVCLKNGGLARKSVCQRLANGDWAQFDRLIQQTSPGNRGQLLVSFPEPEIWPQNKQGVFRFTSGPSSSVTSVAAFADPVCEARAVVEQQAMALRVHAEDMGLSCGHGRSSGGRLFVTGGGAVSPVQMQIYANVFAMPVYAAAAASGGAALGAAIRAFHGYTMSSQQARPSSVALPPSSDPVCLATPDAKSCRIYSNLLPVYASVEKSL